ncbi:hypothetical protein [Leptolyngbya phage Lbo-JY16]
MSAANIEKLRRLVYDCLSIPSNKHKTIAVNQSTLKELVDGYDLLLKALEASNLLLRTKRHACESTEVCRVLDVHIERNAAALAKARGAS